MKMNERINRIKSELEDLALEYERQRAQLDAFAKAVKFYAHYADREITDKVSQSLGAREIEAIDEYFESQQL
jgi:hypothetical protein